MVGLAGGGIPGNIVDEGRGDLIGDVDASAPTMNTGTMRDPVDDSSTVDVPAGWDSVAYSSGDFEVHRHVVSSVSPDGKTVMFVGDPSIPSCWDPAFATDIFSRPVLAVVFDTAAFGHGPPSEACGRAGHRGKPCGVEHLGEDAACVLHEVGPAQFAVCAEDGDEVGQFVQYVAVGPRQAVHDFGLGGFGGDEGSAIVHGPALFRVVGIYWQESHCRSSIGSKRPAAVAHR